ncbi:unnamed protein product [Cuscuta campestris]|uniref:Uncharacterized protein n=2 Tax=Cuscuta sect. Cleistogrammica TaxID=1824901 RepID=A0A484KL95_9ASTE|nr:hypothetical protein DM860_013499 [Cuscuta australis]VFQ63889.1 unnamed protein product [Cuscuta campestris]
MSSPQSHLSEASDDGHDNDDQENLESHDDGDNVGQENLGSHDDHVPDSSGDGDASDMPPESYCVPADAEQDWLYRNATLLRKTSRKMVFPRDFSHGIKCSRASLSRMRSLSLIAFPAAPKHWAADGIQRHNGVSLFRSRSEPVENLVEPPSPVVTCTGRVRSKNGNGKTGIVKWFGAVLRIGLGRRRRDSTKGNPHSTSSGSMSIVSKPVSGPT